MDLTFPVLAAMGVMLFFLFPQPKEKWERIASRGGAAAFFAVGVVGSAVTALA